MPKNKYKCTWCGGSGEEPSVGDSVVRARQIGQAADQVQALMEQLADMGEDFSVTMGDAVDEMRGRGWDIWVVEEDGIESGSGGADGFTPDMLTKV